MDGLFCNAKNLIYICLISKRKLIWRNSLKFIVLTALLLWLCCTQSCPTLYDPVDCSLPGSSVHGILQARILEEAAISYSRGFSWPRDQTHVSRGFFTTELPKYFKSNKFSVVEIMHISAYYSFLISQALLCIFKKEVDLPEIGHIHDNKWQSLHHLTIY